MTSNALMTKKQPREDEIWRLELGQPSDEALEYLPLRCAHCSATFVPRDLPYDANARAFARPGLIERFMTLTRDSETDEFLISSRRTPRKTHVSRAEACTELRKRMSLTEANAAIGRGRMFVFSEAHVESLLRETNCGRRWGLDVGAGCGEVTKRLRRGTEKMCATESSRGMCARLRESEVDVVLESDTVEGVVERVRGMGHDVSKDGFDVVWALNLVDRVDKPRTLLKELKAAVNARTGVVILAIVVPFRPFVEGADGTRGVPSEVVDAPSSGSWEAGVEALWTNLIEPSGFDILKLSRVPYISEGDHKFGAYVLDDAVFVLRPKKD